VLATDAAGAVVRAVRYLPFGGIDEVSADTGVLTQNLRFPGQRSAVPGRDRPAPELDA